jgi:anion-transporting  ArsA/GET3 family ATPase
MADQAVERRLQMVVGKGGVGKSTVAAALALAEARRGRRVLALELGRPGGLARIFGKVPPERGAPIEVRPNLHLAYVEGESALAEYLELVVPIRRLLAAVFTSRIYRFFVAAAPGLKELMTIGKVWYEQDRKDGDGGYVWDRLVVDAGASGHSLQYLQMPSTAAQTFTTGLVHREAARVEALLKDASRTAVHVVATAEEMPVTEAIEIVARLRGELGLPLGKLFLNRWRPSVPDGARELLPELDRLHAPSDLQAPAGGFEAEEVLDGVRLAAARAVAWDEVQKRSAERLSAVENLSVERLPLLVTEELGLREIERLAALVAPKEPS